MHHQSSQHIPSRQRPSKHTPAGQQPHQPTGPYQRSRTKAKPEEYLSPFPPPGSNYASPAEQQPHQRSWWTRAKQVDHPQAAHRRPSSDSGGISMEGPRTPSIQDRVSGTRSGVVTPRYLAPPEKRRERRRMGPHVLDPDRVPFVWAPPHYTRERKRMPTHIPNSSIVVPPAVEALKNRMDDGQVPRGGSTYGMGRIGRLRGTAKAEATPPTPAKATPAQKQVQGRQRRRLL
jgi:hypothetical protein